MGAMWCLVTGGEPLLRDDFEDPFRATVGVRCRLPTGARRPWRMKPDSLVPSGEDEARLTLARRPGRPLGLDHVPADVLGEEGEPDEGEEHDVHGAHHRGQRERREIPDPPTESTRVRAESSPARGSLPAALTREVGVSGLDCWVVRGSADRGTGSGTTQDPRDCSPRDSRL